MFQTSVEEVDQMIVELTSTEAIRSEVASLSKTWIKNVMSQPSKKNKDARRSFEYSKKKLETYLLWRKENNISELVQANILGTDKEFLEDVAEKSLYWYGVDRQGRPILWEIFERFDWKNLNTERKLKYYMLLFETIFHVMPPEIDSVCVVAITDGIPYLRAINKPRFFFDVAKLFTKVFPDRLGGFYGLANAATLAVFQLLKPVLPAKVRNKMQFYNREKMRQELLHNLLPEGEDLPDFLGGSVIHDEEVIGTFSRMISSIKSDMKRNQGVFIGARADKISRKL
mmetsp:Transcript_12973/g.19453  ORF Transcript_12973/g.19453 Transcript_12973/m.19453 type:complete len:285 (-) Transcript_12973:130-984(-)|eukprot:CAMPEP_0116030270 /NCGR_PEP_ID=MMETSP0321-20121206/16755_1 /TAXON_ID=163516 /ORGANISM="Leptocylindrus danicus var. danicus, Strain B650" /LENGTH=284 /DNA_ID=CAMNT_0003505045 /DNA_START=52 /DNA_END=906 /DNA_ORIENTATION=+